MQFLILVCWLCLSASVWWGLTAFTSAGEDGKEIRGAAVHQAMPRGRGLNSWISSLSLLILQLEFQFITQASISERSVEGSEVKGWLTHFSLSESERKKGSGPQQEEIKLSGLGTAVTYACQAPEKYPPITTGLGDWLHATIIWVATTQQRVRTHKCSQCVCVLVFKC